MTTVANLMKTSEAMRDAERGAHHVGAALRAAAAQADGCGIGWNDSSWDLAHGLVVVEDLPIDAWPLELPLGGPRPALS